ncbi:hypothetical protein [Rhodopseudomonas palustris]
MDRFIRDENLKLYRRALSETKDADQRKILLALIAALEVQARSS